MGVIDDIQQLGLELTDEDRDEIERISNYIDDSKKDEVVRDTMKELHIMEYLHYVRPDIMNALVKKRERENKEWFRQSERKYDEKGDRICDEITCSSTENVRQCVYCGKYICREHCYGDDPPCCYACWIRKTAENSRVPE